MASANVGECLSGAWSIYKRNAITHVVCTFLVMAVTSLSAGLLAGPMIVGYLRMIERVIDVGDDGTFLVQVAATNEDVEAQIRRLRISIVE